MVTGEDLYKSPKEILTSLHSSPHVSISPHKSLQVSANLRKSPQYTEHGTQNAQHSAQSTEHITHIADHRKQKIEDRKHNLEHRTEKTEHRKHRTQKTQNTEHRTQNTEHRTVFCVLCSGSLHKSPQISVDLRGLVEICVCLHKTPPMCSTTCERHSPNTGKQLKILKMLPLFKILLYTHVYGRVQ